MFPEQLPPQNTQMKLWIDTKCKTHGTLLKKEDRILFMHVSLKYIKTTPKTLRHKVFRSTNQSGWSVYQSGLSVFVNKEKKKKTVFSCISTAVPKGILMHATAGQISKVTFWSSMDLVGTSSGPVVKTLRPNKYLCPNQAFWVLRNSNEQEGFLTKNLIFTFSPCK